MLFEGRGIRGRCQASKKKTLLAWQRPLNLSNRTSPIGTNLNTGLAADAFAGVNRFGLPVNHLIDRCWTGADTLFTSLAFILIDNDFPHDNLLF